MNVFYFGTGARRLFGVYLPGAGEGAGAKAAVLCAPWGQEYLRAHRSIRQLGAQLNANGFHVLRFDYYGTGDSAGEMAEASVRDWELDVAQAVDELRDTSGARRVSLVGLRLGATLAARTSSERPDDVGELVLWDPIVSGRDYVDELRNGAAATTGRPSPNDTVQVEGFSLTPPMASELCDLDLLSLADRLPAKTLVVNSQQPAPKQHALNEALAQKDSRTRVEVIDAPPAWVEYQGSGTALMPVNVLQRIVEWLA